MNLSLIAKLTEQLEAQTKAHGGNPSSYSAFAMNFETANEIISALAQQAQPESNDSRIAWLVAENKRLVTEMMAQPVPSVSQALTDEKIEAEARHLWVPEQFFAKAVAFAKWARDQAALHTPVAQTQDEARGTFACPICGVGTPHGHHENSIQHEKVRRVFERVYMDLCKFSNPDIALRLRVDGWGLIWQPERRNENGFYRDLKLNALWILFKLGWDEGRAHTPVVVNPEPEKCEHGGPFINERCRECHAIQADCPGPALGGEKGETP